MIILGLVGKRVVDFQAIQEYPPVTNLNTTSVVLRLVLTLTLTLKRGLILDNADFLSNECSNVPFPSTCSLGTPQTGHRFCRVPITLSHKTAKLLIFKSSFYPRHDVAIDPAARRQTCYRQCSHRKTKITQ